MEVGYVWNNCNKPSDPLMTFYLLKVLMGLFPCFILLSFRSKSLEKLLEVTYFQECELDFKPYYSM